MPLPTHISESTRRLNPQLFPASMVTNPEPRIMRDATEKAHKRIAPSEDSESRIQQRFIAWWATRCADFNLSPELLMAFPLQGKRTRANGSRMKAEGMRAGTPDMFLAVPVGKYHGLWIEMKRPGGRIVPSQHGMLGLLDRQGYAAFACYGFDDAVRLVNNYLNGEQFF